MEYLYWVIAGVVTIKATAMITLYIQKKKDADRRQRQRAEHDQQREQVERRRIVEDIKAYFPDVSDDLPVGSDSNSPFKSAVHAAMAKLKGTRLGRVRLAVGGLALGLSAVWPLAQRLKGGYFVGRTGSGKTTLLTLCAKANVDDGDGMGAMAPEHEWFVETLLPLCADRAEDVVYYAPGDPRCPIFLGLLELEPGDDPGFYAASTYNILRNIIGTDSLGVRSGPILANAVSTLVGRPGSTLMDVKRLFEDAAFRERIVSETTDAYCRDFWTKTYPGYPSNAYVPVITKLDEFLRNPLLRRALCSPGNLSIRKVLAEKKILLVDLGRLDVAATLLIGQLILARVRGELLRRERIPTAERTRFFFYCDEFQVTAGVAQDDWRAVLSRGRRYGLALTLAHQFPSQVPTAVRDEILSNVSSIVAFSVGSKDGEVLKKELLYRAAENGSIRPVPLEALVNQPVGHAVAKLGTGALAFPLRVDPPVEVPPREVGDRVREISWKKFGGPAMPAADKAEPAQGDAAPRSAATDLSELELKFLRVVVEQPGKASGEYAKLTGLNGTRAARVRKKLVAAGYLREHRLARKPQGKPALVLEPLEPAKQACEVEVEAGT